MKVKVGIVGCGNMGQALLGAIISKKYTTRSNIFCSDKDKFKLKSVRAKFKVNASASSRDVVKKCAVIILAIKPQDLDTL
ncbi:MAG: NAD(P)-binding domain-containing protein, partial [Omnitrophica bacterium]|nr:NAD(P)-binding domain-containing protein [Candidatus Omnitrophota bacterium]